MADINTDVTGRDDLTDAVFHISTPTGLLLVDGCVYGDFGLHPDRGAIAFTHLPTGQVLGRFGGFDAAYAAMGEACCYGCGRS